MSKLLIRIFNRYQNTLILIKSMIDTRICYFQLNILGIKIGKNNIFFGLPIIRKNANKNTRIEIGINNKFRSDKKSNLIGINHACIISANGNDSYIKIGNNCGFSGVTISASKQIMIGDSVKCGANVLITDHNWHNLTPEGNRNTPDPNPKPIKIEDNVFIGYNTIILKGVTIGKNSIIGAGSVVVKSIPHNVIASGNPCQIIKEL
ncbi:MAG: acyltransferase [Bacteroidales bacterium]|nr:acyltransferase [Bacteroidales bacterium]